MSDSYLNKTGLAYFWSKIKAWCTSLFALDNAVVHKTGNETIRGHKSFVQASLIVQNPYVELDTFETSYENYHNNTEIFFADKNYDPSSGSVPIVGTTRLGEIQWQRRGNSGGDSFELTLRGASDPEGPFVLGSLGIMHKPLSGVWYGYCPSTPLPSVDNTATAIVTRNFIPLDTRIVHTTGDEEISGLKTFKSSMIVSASIPRLDMQMTNVDSTVVSTTNKIHSAISFCDKNGLDQKYRIAVIQSGMTSFDTNFVRMFAYDPTADSVSYAGITIHYPRGGDPYVLGVTPASLSDDSTKIPTTEWVRDATGNFACNAATATKLATARSLKTKLDSTATVTFDGSAAQDSIPVTGTLAISNGGTGGTTIEEAQNNLLYATSHSSGSYDFDEFRSSSIHSFGSGTTLTNCPDGANGILITFGSAGIKKQFWSRLGTIGSNDHYLGFRTGGSTNWSNWYKIYTDSDIIPISNGGTGSVTRLGALRALTNEAVGIDANYFLTITTGWGKGGYTSVADAKTVLGLKSAAYTESSDYATDSSVVHNTGNETIAGNKTFSAALRSSVAGTYHYVSNPNLVKGTLPSSQTNFYFPIGDKTIAGGATHYFAAQEVIVRTDGEVVNRLYAFKNATSSSDSTSISLVYPASGNPYATAPAPSAGDSSNKIATTAYVQGEISGFAADSDVVHKAGTETITGAKSFSSSVNVLHVVARGTNPTSNTYKQFNFLDSSATNSTSKRAANIENLIASTGDVSLYLRAYKWAATGGANANLEIKYPIDGEPSLLWNGSDIIKHATVCSNCNTALDAGLYKTTSSTTNAPDAFGGILTVERADDGSSVWQTVKSYTTDYYKPIWTRQVILNANGAYSSATAWVISSYLPTSASRSLFNNSISGKLAFCPPDGTQLRGQSGSIYEFMRLYHTRDWGRDSTGESYGYIGRYSATTSPTDTSANQAQFIIGESCGGISSNNFSFGCYYQCASDVVYTDTTTERVYGVYLKAGDTYNDKTVESVTYFRNTNNKPWFRYNYDNVCTLGDGNYRFSTVYAGTGTINTSDERLKSSIDLIPDDVLDAWGAVVWVQYQFNDALEEKGGGARLHTGAVAQRISEAFAARGLDASRYGLFCYDRWDEEWDESEDGVRVRTRCAGDRYSLRYEEALAMEAAYLRRENARLEERVSDLEDRLAALELRFGSA